MKKKFLVVFGTRPEAVKLAPVIGELRKRDNIEVKVCVTGQHREMLDSALKLFEIVPDYDLDVMKQRQDLYDVTARVLLGMKGIFAEAAPDCVVVQGDTTTTFVSSLAAFYDRTPVAHVEAGLRTGNLAAPFPEEANRILTTRLAEFHFAPTQNAADNLRREGIPPDRIWVTGNTGIDALLWVRDKVRAVDWSDWKSPCGTAWQAVVENRPLILITGHRRESFGDGMQQICYAVRQLARRYPAWHFVYPVHLNPNVQQPVSAVLGGLSNVHLLPPLDYMPFVFLMDRCRLILTDSGGVQEEAPSLGKPVLVMREVTERQEAIEAGYARLVGTNAERIIAETIQVMTDDKLYLQMSSSENPYGDGKAGERIAGVLEREFGCR